MRGTQDSGRRFAHVGVAVANLEEAVEFYRVFLQADPIHFWESDRKPFLDELVGYEAVMREALFPLGDGYLELLEYSEPKPGATSPESNNVGHMHLCIEVDDLEAEFRRLKEADLGIEFRSDAPVLVPDHEPDFRGERYLYLRTPDGSTFELYQPAAEPAGA
jgi:catechol 2,3-dioxygenase-like lactoylglutathione lyase family enzyme